MFLLNFKLFVQDNTHHKRFESPVVKIEDLGKYLRDSSFNLLLLAYLSVWISN